MCRRFTVVGSVCVSVKSRLTSGVSVRPENTQQATEVKICGVFTETAPFKSYGVICLPVTSYKGTAVTFRAPFQRQILLRVLKRLTIG